MCMVKKGRCISYTIDEFFKQVRGSYIRTDVSVQRAAGNYTKQELNEMLYTVFTGDHIPELILAENNEDLFTYVVDGLQRLSMLLAFRYGNYKITSAMDNSIVQYQEKKLIDGKIQLTEGECNLKGKTYDSLPEELRNQFDNFHLSFYVHENCTTMEIANLLKRYNVHKSMSVSQQSVTYIPNFADSIKDIINGKFFIENKTYSEAQKTNGTVERIVIDAITQMFHPDLYKKDVKKTSKLLNENCTLEEFNTLADELDELVSFLPKELYKLFDNKDSAILFTTYHRFKEIGLDNEKFIEFLHSFSEGITYEEFINIKTVSNSTKDKSVMERKINYITDIMYDYLHINIEETQSEEINTLDFIRENVSEDVTEEDIAFYQDMLDDLTLNVDNSSKLLNKENVHSLLAIIAYSCRNDIDLDDWLVDYFAHNTTYIKNQKQNYITMVNGLNKYISNTENNTITYMKGGQVICAMQN